MEKVEKSHPQSCPFGGVGARSDFVDEDQAGELEPAHHILYPQEVRGKGAQILNEVLLVANVGVDSLEDRQGGVLGWDGNPGVRHKGEQPHGLQGHCLTPCIGACNHQGAVLRGQPEANGDDILFLTAHLVG